MFYLHINRVYHLCNLYNFYRMNLFQHKNQDPDIQDAVLEEFDGMVRTLESHDIPVVVVEDTKEPETPDAIFPNNWFSTHGDGSLVLYPMFEGRKETGSHEGDP